MSDVTLTVDGLICGGWKSVSVRQSIETISGTFSLSVSERWPGQQTLKAILPGQKCLVTLDGETVITGYVDDVAPAYSSTSHEVSIDGRDVWLIALRSIVRVNGKVSALKPSSPFWPNHSGSRLLP